MITDHICALFSTKVIDNITKLPDSVVHELQALEDRCDVKIDHTSAQ